MYRKVMLYTSKDWEKNIFSDDITFITLSKTSDMLERISTNLNNNPRIYKLVLLQDFSFLFLLFVRVTFSQFVIV